MAKLITEAFNIKNATRTANDGHKYNIAYIDPNTSEPTYNFKDELKKYGAKYFSDLKAWGWFLGNNPEETYKKYIQPCLEYLVSVEDSGSGGRQNEVINIIDQLITEISSGNISQLNVPRIKNLKEELQQYKADLMRCVGSEEFKKKIEPIIKFQQAQGHAFSFKNALMIMFQDKDATLVKSKSGWLKMNRVVTDTSHPILLWRPSGQEKMTPEEKEAETANYLYHVGVNSVNELNPGQKEELNVRLRGKGNPENYKAYFGYDIRFTKQIEGKEEIVGDDYNEHPDWYDKSSDKNEYLSLVIDGATKMIEDSGLNINYVPYSELGGALGYATGNKIVLANDAEPTLNYANTIFHEFSHHLLHLKYLKKTHETSGMEWAQYYVGTEKGRKVVEQQAEICAWLVLKHFGFDVTNTSAVYAAGWGMTTPKIAAHVFDTISNCASFIMQKVGKYMSEVSENNK